MIRQNSPKNKKIGVLSGYSKEELLRMIDEEVGKPEKEIDAELVNACVEAALLKDHESLPGCEAEMPSAEPCVIKFRNAQSTRKKRKRRTIIALAACVSILAAVFLTPISSYAFNFSILDTIATWYRDKVAVKTGNLNSSQQEIYTEEEVRQALADEGIENVLLPHYETD